MEAIFVTKPASHSHLLTKLSPKSKHLFSSHHQSLITTRHKPMRFRVITAIFQKQQQLPKTSKMSPTAKSKASPEAEPWTVPPEWSTSLLLDSSRSQRWPQHRYRWLHHALLCRRTRLKALHEVASRGRRESEPLRSKW